MFTQRLCNRLYLPSSKSLRNHPILHKHKSKWISTIIFSNIFAWVGECHRWAFPVLYLLIACSSVERVSSRSRRLYHSDWHGKYPAFRPTHWKMHKRTICLVSSTKIMARDIFPKIFKKTVSFEIFKAFLFWFLFLVFLGKQSWRP